MLIILHNNSISLVPTSSGQTLWTSSFYWIIMYFLHSISRFFFICGNFFIQYINCYLKTRTQTKKRTENFHFVTIRGREEPWLKEKRPSLKLALQHIIVLQKEAVLWSNSSSHELPWTLAAMHYHMFCSGDHRQTTDHEQLGLSTIANNDLLVICWR